MSLPNFKIYCAGKITKCDWRHKFLIPEASGSWPNKDAYCGAIPFTYTGPYFVGCDHGCTHGVGLHANTGGPHCETCPNYEDTNAIRKDVAKKCLKAIRNSDVVFAWINEMSCYGTLWELGYAKGKGIKTVVGIPYYTNLDDLWFTFQTADIVMKANSVEEALRTILIPPIPWCEMRGNYLV